MKNAKFFLNGNKKILFVTEKQKNAFAGKKTWFKWFESLKEKPIVIIAFFRKINREHVQKFGR